MEEKYVCESLISKDDFVIEQFNNILNEIWEMQNSGDISIYSTEATVKFKTLKALHGIMNDLHRKVS